VKSPAFQVYPADFLADKNTLVMSAAEVGSYWLLLCVCWRENGLPDDVQELADLARTPLKQFQPSWDRKIQRCFEKREDGKWDHGRLVKERDKQAENREKRKVAGEKGAKAKWQTDSKAKAKPSPKLKPVDGNAMPTDSLSSSTSSSTTTTDQKKAKEPSAFAEFMKFLSLKIGPIPNPGKEGKAISWLIENGYDFLKCRDCYESLAGESWRTATVTWTTVKAEIGGWVSKGGTNGSNQKRFESSPERNARNLRENGEYIRGLQNSSGESDCEDPIGLLASRI